MIDNIPEKLKAYDNWLVYNIEDKKKISYSPITGRKNCKEGLASFDVAVKVLQESKGKYKGLSFQLEGTPYCCIDLDDHAPGRKVDEFVANEILPHFMNTYIEYSQSGNGLHIFCEAEVVKGINNNNKGIEIYSDGRYICVTGDIIAKEATRDITNKQKEVDELYKKYKTSTNSNNTMFNDPVPLEFDEETELTASTIIETIKNSKQKEKFIGLFEYGFYGAIKDSEADASLMCILAYWTDCNPTLMACIFNRSVLTTRISSDGTNKWLNREDYRQRTIEMAISYIRDSAVKQIREQSHIKDNQPPILDTSVQPFYKKGKLDSSVPDNTMYVANTMGLQIRRNEITGDNQYLGIINNHNLESLSPDSVVTVLRGEFSKIGYVISKEMLIDHLILIGEKNKYNPVKDFFNRSKVTYLANCNAPGDSITQKVFSNCVVLPGAVSREDRGFSYTLFKKWLVSVARITFNTGDEATQGILVLKGKQGIGKTRFVQSLLPKELRGYIVTGKDISVGDKDTMLSIMGNSIIELGEYGRVKGSNVDKLKAIITQSVDEVRKPYSKSIEKRPRIASFVATVNDDTFLKDDTGERRNWVIEVEALNRIDSIEDETIYTMLWGEAMYLAFDEEYPIYLRKAEQKQLEQRNSHYKVLSIEEQTLIDVLDWDRPVDTWSEYTATQVIELLGDHGKKLKPNNLGKILRGMAKSEDIQYRGVTFRRNGKQGNLYRLPPVKTYAFNDYDSVFIDTDINTHIN